MEDINKRLALLLESLCRSECEDREQPNTAARAGSVCGAIPVLACHQLFNHGSIL